MCCGKAIKSISFAYLMKALGSLEWLKPTISCFLINNWYFASYLSFSYRYILSVSGWWLINISNEFVFHDSDLPVINVQYGWSGSWGQFTLSSFKFFPVTSSNLIIFILFYYISISNFVIFAYYIDLFYMNMFFCNQLNVLSDHL